MDLLVLGSNGLLGSNVVAHALSQSESVVAAYHTDPPAFDVETVDFDIVDGERFVRILEEYDPETVVNCAALTDVDGCEQDQSRAREVNGTAPGRLTTLASERDIQFVHVSTDYVFDGRASSPYDESDKTDPVQMYGESKLMGETAVTDADSDALIPRLSFVYGRRGDSNELVGFPAWVAERLRAEEEVSLFTDQHVTPTRAGRAAQTVLDLLETDATGPIHVACRSCVTPYQMGEEVAKMLESDTSLLTKGAMKDISREAERPTYTCLDTDRVASVLAREQPTLREDLQKVF